MRRIAGLLALALLLAPLACGGPPPRLAWQFQKDVPLVYRTSATIDNQSPMGAMKMDFSTDVSLLPTGTTEDGRTRAECTIERITVNTEHPMLGKVEYDSSVPGSAEKYAGNPLVSQFTKLAGQKFTLDVDETGTVGDIQGADGNELASIAEELLTGFPKSDVKAGDTWTTSAERSSGGMPVEMEMAYTVKSLEEVEGATVATISFASKKLELGKIEPDPNNPLSAMASQLKVSDGKVTGELRFDMTAGRLLENHADTTMTLSMDMMGNKMEITTKVSSTTKRVE